MAVEDVVESRTKPAKRHAVGKEAVLADSGWEDEVLAGAGWVRRATFSPAC